MLDTKNKKNVYKGPAILLLLESSCQGRLRLVMITNKGRRDGGLMTQGRVEEGLEGDK